MHLPPDATNAAAVEPPPILVPGPAWYERPVLAVARDLLGALLTHRSDDGSVALRITEVEAYGGRDDPGSHAYRGRSPRNESMFADGGRLYVYRHLGLHHCVNIVCGSAGDAAAVLLRAGEIVDGVELARERRLRRGVVDSERQIARGPARLAVALGLDLRHDGLGVTMPDGEVTLHRPAEPAHTGVATGPRVGVSGDAGRADLYPWRLWLVDEPTVSAYRRVSQR